MSTRGASRQAPAECRIESWGNGLVFEIVRVRDGATMLLQGDDAARFDDELGQAGERNLEEGVADLYFD